jgi:spore coat protein CotF
MAEIKNKEMTEMDKKMAEVVNQLIYRAFLLSIHHCLPHRTTSSVANSASNNLMEKQYKIWQI